MKPLEPIITVDLFPTILDRLLELLSSLSDSDWNRPTACPSWSVKDVALHLLGDEISILSRKRDGYSLSSNVKDWDELVNSLNELNAQWVEATRRISSRLLVDLLRYTGSQVCVFFRSLDPYVLGNPVSWAGPDPAPIWLDLAREYTERWLHQTHIREAVCQPGLRQPGFFAPVLETFVRALPQTYSDVPAADGTLVALSISGSSGGLWLLRREDGQWLLGLGAVQQPDAEVAVDEDIAWRIFTKGLSKAQARAKITITGDQVLGRKVLDMVSIIA
jgi:uncharacterized protein (TIGR03083 family)